MRCRVSRLARLVRWMVVVVLTMMLLLPGAAQVLPVWQVIVVQGASMTPYMRVGDVIVIERGSSVRVDDVVTVRRDDGSLVTHRVTEVNSDGSLVLRGDANTVPDPGSVAASDVLGTVSAVLTEPWSILIRAATSTVGRFTLAAAVFLLVIGPALLRRPPRADQPSLPSLPA